MKQNFKNYGMFKINNLALILLIIYTLVAIGAYFFYQHVTNIQMNDRLSFLQSKDLIFVCIAIIASLIIGVVFIVVAAKNGIHYSKQLSVDWNEEKRACKHEVMNHLQVIQALIELGYKDKAIAYIQKVANGEDVNKKEL